MRRRREPTPENPVVAARLTRSGHVGAGRWAPTLSPAGESGRIAPTAQSAGRWAPRPETAMSS